MTTGMPRCVFCGRTPAIEAVFEGKHGVPDQAQPFIVDAAFCRDCGIATFRDATEWTMAHDWSSLTSFVTVPMAVAANLRNRRRVAALDSPGLGQDWPTRPLGAPLLRRRATARVLVPFVLLVVGVVVLISVLPARRQPPAPLTVGSCVRFADQQDVKLGGLSLTTGSGKVVSCTAPHDGVITQLAENTNQCSIEGVWLTDGQGRTYCVRLDRS